MDGKYRMPKLPRAAYWAVGATVACTGALLARELGDRLPEYQVFIWLAGAGVIFVGIAILSLGTRAHLEAEDDRAG